jgi:hypothetical protein
MLLFQSLIQAMLTTPPQFYSLSPIQPSIHLNPNIHNIQEPITIQQYTKKKNIKRGTENEIENKVDLICDPFPADPIQQRLCSHVFIQNEEEIATNRFNQLKNNNPNQVKAIVRREVSFQLLFIYILFFWQIIKLFDE